MNRDGRNRYVIARYRESRPISVVAGRRWRTAGGALISAPARLSQPCECPPAAMRDPPPSRDPLATRHLRSRAVTEIGCLDRVVEPGKGGQARLDLVR